MTKLYPIFMSNRMIDNMSEYCQAQPQLNSTQLQLKLRLRLALIPLSQVTHPPSHPANHPKKFISKINLKDFNDLDFFSFHQDYFKTIVRLIQFN